MSRYVEPTRAEIERIVTTHLNVTKRVNEKSGPHAICDCVLCGKAKHLYVNLDTGLFDCKVCGQAGGFWKLADALGVKVRESSVVKSVFSVMVGQRKNSTGIKEQQAKKVMDGPNLDIARVTSASERLFDETDTEAQKVRAYLHGRGFTDDTIRRFRLGVCGMFTKGEDGSPQREAGVAVPYVEAGKVPLVKMRNLATQKDKRRFQRTKGGDSRLFNADAVRDVKRVVLVEGELDAVSLHQAGITTVASTSLGAQKTVPLEWSLVLSDADEIVLWYDDDEAGQEAVQALMHEFGSWRVKVASIDNATSDFVLERTGKRPKDANDLLKAGVDYAAIQAIVKNAVAVDNTALVTLDRYADPLQSAIEGSEKSLGIPTGLDVLDKTIRGWRPGLTVVTGHTSHGKSTFALDRCIDLASRGEPVMVTAFENGPLVLARKVFQKYYGKPISAITTPEEKQAALGLLPTMNRYPVYVVDSYGRMNVGDLVDHIVYARKRHGIRVAMVDHLHFLKPRVERRDEREAMDEIVQELAEVAAVNDVCIMLIVHPRGAVELSTIPTGDSAKGTSSIKQLADCGITVWRDTERMGDKTIRKLNLKDGMGRRQEVEISGSEAFCSVWKARHDEASTGGGVISFDARRLAFADRAKEPAKEAAKGQTLDDGFQVMQEALPIKDPFND
jgi:twinkle protein